jgi:hypothetical protein
VAGLVEANVSEKRALSIIRAERLFTLALQKEKAGFSETLASTSPATRRFKPKEHHQKCHLRENLKSHR